MPFFTHVRIQWSDDAKSELVLKDGCYFVFGGDAGDKRDGTIRFVKLMVKLKQRYPWNVNLSRSFFNFLSSPVNNTKYSTWLGSVRNGEIDACNTVNVENADHLAQTIDGSINIA